MRIATIGAMIKATIGDMIEVTVKAIEMDGMMMISGALGMQNDGGDLMLDGGETTMDTTVHGAPLLIGLGVAIMVGLAGGTLIHSIVHGTDTMALIVIAMGIAVPMVIMVVSGDTHLIITSFM
jgi:hypothetical protein